jgi:pentatricopeptide repeat protein
VSGAINSVIKFLLRTRKLSEFCMLYDRIFSLGILPVFPLTPGPSPCRRGEKLE